MLMLCYIIKSYEILNRLNSHRDVHVFVAVGGGGGGGAWKPTHNTLEFVISSLIIQHSGHSLWPHYPSGDPIYLQEYANIGNTAQPSKHTTLRPRCVNVVSSLHYFPNKNIILFIIISIFYYELVFEITLLK